MDAAPPPVPEEPPARDWSVLPFDALASVFVRVGAVDVLMGVGLVCRSWLQAAMLPDVWRVLDMENHEIVLYKDGAVLCAMAKAAVDRSDGQLRVFAGKKFVNDELLTYMVERSPSLTSLRLVSCCNAYSQRLINVIRESPLLELRSLELDDVDITIGALTAVLENCPVLEVLQARNCFGTYSPNRHKALPAKFARIKTMKLEYDNDYGRRYYYPIDEIGIPFDPELWGAPRPQHGLVYTAVNYCKALFKRSLNKFRYHGS